MSDQLLKKGGPILNKVNLSARGYLPFYASMAVFLLVAGVYGGFVLLNRNLTNTQEKLDETIRTKEEGLRRDLKGILLFESRLKNLNALIAAHRLPSRVVKFFEDNTLPQVQFKSFNLGGASRKVNLSAQTFDFRTLAQQISHLEQNPDVEHVEFGGLSFSEKRRINFALDVVFKPEIFQLE